MWTWTRMKSKVKLPLPVAWSLLNQVHYGSLADHPTDSPKPSLRLWWPLSVSGHLYNWIMGSNPARGTDVWVPLSSFAVTESRIVGIVTRLDNWQIGVLFASGIRDVYLLHSIPDRLCGPRSLLPNGFWRLPPGKAAGLQADLSLLSSPLVSNVCNYTPSPPYLFMAWLEQFYL
jgi:hypothetical protein